MPATDQERMLIEIKADIRDFSRQMQKMQRDADKATRGVSSSFARMNKAISSANLGGLAKTFAGGLGLGIGLTTLRELPTAIRGLVSSFADLSDAADAIGITTDALQELQYAGKQAGLSADDVTNAMKKFTVSSAKAASGQGELAKFLKAAGIQWKNADGSIVPIEQRLADVSDLLARTGDASQRARIALAAFGKGGLGTVNMLGQGSAALAEMRKEAETTGNVLHANGSQVQDLDDDLTSLVGTITTQLQQAVINIIQGTDDWETSLREVQQGIVDLVETLTGASASFSGFLDLLDRFDKWTGKKMNLGNLPGTQAIHDARVALGLDEGTKKEKRDAEIAALRKQIDDLKYLQAHSPKPIGGLAAATEAGGVSAVDPITQSIDEHTAKLDALLKEQHDETTAAARESFEKSKDASEAHVVAATAGKDAANKLSTAAEKLIGAAGALSTQPAMGGIGSTTADFIKHFEGFRPNAYWDVNAFRTGYGSDTTTSATGEVSKVQKGTTTTEADALRDLERRIGEFQKKIVDQIGADTWAQMSDSVKTALTDIAYNYGQLPKSIVAAVETLKPDKIADAIEGLATDNAGINRRRRESEAALVRGTAGPGNAANVKALVDAQTEAAQKAYDAAQDKAKADNEAKKSLDQYIAGLDEEYAIKAKTLALQGQSSAEIQKQIALMQALNAAAQAKGAPLTPAETATVTQKVTATQQVEQQQADISAGTDAQIQRMDELRSLSSDVFGGIVSDLRAGASAGEIFANVLDKIISKLADMAINSLTDSLFGKTGTAGGGLFGNLLNFGGGASTAGVASASTFASAGVGLFAKGGDPPVNVPSIVGEEGPELFVPKVAGTVVPNDKLRAGVDISGGIKVEAGPGLVTTMSAIAARQIAENNRGLPRYLEGRQQRGF